MNTATTPGSTPRAEPELPPSLDPLTEALGMLKLTGVLYCRAELTAPWGIDLPRLPGCMMIHIINAGRCWLDVAGQAPMLLEAGSLAMLPHGTGHQLRSEPQCHVTPLSEIPIELMSDRYEVMRFGGGGAPTRVTYCGVRFDDVAARRLLQLLPLVLKLDTSDEDDDWLHDTVRLISREADEMRPGGETIITRLADVVVIQAIRAWVASTQQMDHGWLAALRDPFIGRALAAIHRAPEHAWSVASLARDVGLSRSAFSARFTQLVGESVMQYVTGWRMQLARAHLMETGDPLAAVAARLGYQSEAAFSRAFKREVGVSPGSVRKAS